VQAAELREPKVAGEHDWVKQPPRAEHEVESDADRVRIRVRGEIDLAVADNLQKWISEAIGATPGVSEAVVDLAAVTFLDSTGIRALVLAQRDARENGVPMRISGARGRVEMVLKLTGVFELLTAGP
jgi:anti-anti-sigma factor